MDAHTEVFDFMMVIGEDPRIGPSHISLYMAILLVYQQQNYRMPFAIISKDLMKKAKIAARGTYHKCLRDLRELGYIKYEPSYNPMSGSLIYLGKLVG